MNPDPCGLAVYSVGQAVDDLASLAVSPAARLRLRWDYALLIEALTRFAAVVEAIEHGKEVA